MIFSRKNKNSIHDESEQNETESDGSVSSQNSENIDSHKSHGSEFDFSPFSQELDNEGCLSEKSKKTLMQHGFSNKILENLELNALCEVFETQEKNVDFSERIPDLHTESESQEKILTMIRDKRYGYDPQYRAAVQKSISESSCF